MTTPLTNRNNIARLVCSVIDSSDIGNLLNKVKENLGVGELEEADLKLRVLGNFYNHLPGCAFFRNTLYNYYHYLKLKKEYEELVIVKQSEGEKK